MDAEQDIVKQHITADCAGCWIDSLHEFLSEILASAVRPVAKCLIYAPIFGGAELDFSVLTRTMNELNSLVLNSDSALYALYGLSVFFRLCSLELSSLKVVDI
jgi:hypothetical protein